MKRVPGLLLIGFVATLSRSAATVLTWSGATGGGFSTGTNWVGNTAPASGDSVEFTSTVTLPNTTISFTGGVTTLVGDITFSGTSRPSYSFGGTGNPTLGLEGDVTLSPSGNVTFASGLAINLANNLAHTPFDIASGTQLTIEGVISGAVGIIKKGAGTLIISGANNTYTDKTFIKEGVLEITKLNNYGSITNYSSIGSPTNQGDGYIVMGDLLTSGVLRYTGPAVTTNRGIDLAGTTGGGTVEASGTGALVIADVKATGAGSKSFTLAGTSNDFNTVSGVISNKDVSNTTAVVKSGTGTWKLTAANTYSGGTTISGGKLIADHDSALGTGSVNLSGGTLNITSGRTITNSITFTSTGNASVLAGNGTVGSSFSATTNSVLAPGDSIGTLNFSNGLTLDSGSAISFEIQSPSGAAGTGYDLLNVTGGGINLTASTNTITFNVITLDTNGARGALQSFNSAQAYSWSFAALSAGNTAGTITGFNAGQFNLVTNDFTNSLAGGSLNFSLSGDNRSLLLNFTPVPEPETYVLMGTGLSLLAASALRRRSKVSRPPTA